MSPMWMDYDDEDEDEEEKDKDKDDDKDDDEDDDDEEDTLQVRPRAVILSAAKDLLFSASSGEKKGCRGAPHLAEMWESRNPTRLSRAL